MEPFAPRALRGQVPTPPQRANKTANSVSSGVNPPESTSAPHPKLSNSVSTNQTKTGNAGIHLKKGQTKGISMVVEI